MSRRKQPIVDVEGLEHEDKKELNESELTAVTQLPNLLSIVNESKPTQNFAKFAMQVVSVQRLSSNSEEEDPFLEKYTNIPKTETSFKEDVLSERSSKTTSKSSDQSRKKTRSSFLHLDPLSNWYLFWLFVVSLGVAYNYWTIILRLAFVEGQGKHCQILVILDYVIDSLFLLDIWVQSRTGYMENGELVIKVKKTRRHYMRTLGFLSDCLAVLPTDLLYFAYGINPVFRLGRLLKFHRFLSFYERVEVNTNHHNLFNLTMLIHHVFLIIHWVACVYFLISKNVGYGSDAWVYPALRGEWAQITRQYVYCFYLSSVTMTIVGNLPTPKTPETLLFVIVMYLAGVLVFAMIVGSACEMITSMTIKRTEFHRKINEIKVYMLAHSVPDHLQKRVFKWFDYLWMEKIDLHDEDTFELLPEKCKADILLHVNLDTLKKVEIFEECEPSFLRELVLRLRPTQCCPGDYVCDQGEVGNEMYIVSKGQLEVEVDEQVVATLTPGNHFGEISILDIDGVGNRRTASIRSVGFSQLFKLAKNDLQQALQDYPDARREMEKKAAEILKKDHERKRSTSPEEEIEAKKSCPPDWLAADSVTLQDQIRKVEMQLKEKKLRSIKEKIKKQQAERNKQLIRSFAKRNFLSQNAQEFLQHFVAVNQINEFPILKEKSSNTL